MMFKKWTFCKYFTGEWIVPCCRKMGDWVSKRCWAEAMYIQGLPCFVIIQVNLSLFFLPAPLESGIWVHAEVKNAVLSTVEVGSRDYQ